MSEQHEAALRPDNPAAFPVPMVSDGTHVGDVNQHGMSLRDYFAARALPQIFIKLNAVIDGGVVTIDWSGDIEPEKITEYCASLAYKLADKMLAERSKTP